MKHAGFSLVSLIVGGILAWQSVAGPPVEHVAGEKWRMSASVQAAGMSMPSMTQEVCLPKDNPGDALLKPGDDDGTCRFYDVVRSGNRVTGKMECKGRDGAMKGTYEVVTDGDHIRSSFDGQTADGPMTMKNEATKLGGTCTATRYGPSGMGVGKSDGPPEQSRDAAKKDDALKKGKKLFNGILGHQ